MRQFLSFVKKEWYHIIRDRRTVLILLGIPVMQILLFGFAITTEVKNARLAVFDPSRDEMTQHIKSRFQASEHFILTEELIFPHEINDVFTRGTADLVLIFGESEGWDPYPVSVPVTTTIAAVRRDYGHLEAGQETDSLVGVAGRVVFLRNTGKLCFVTLQDGAGATLQAMLSAKSLPGQGHALSLPASGHGLAGVQRAHRSSAPSPSVTFRYLVPPQSPVRPVRRSRP